MKHSTNDQQACAVDPQDDHQLTAEHMAHIKNFIERVGGIENARQALLVLDELQKAA